MERIKEVRKRLGLTQEKFADKIGIKQNSLTNIETDRRAPSNQVVLAICREFNVNRTWLETGEGDMFNETAEIIVADLTKKYGLDELDQLLIMEYAKLPIEQKNVIKKYLDNVYNGIYTPDVETDIVAVQKKVIKFEQAPHEDTDMREIKIYNEKTAAGFGNYLSDNSDTSYETHHFPAKTVPTNADFGVRISGPSMEPKIRDGEIVWVKCQPVVENGEIGVFILEGEAFCKKIHVDHKNRIIQLISLNKEYPPINVREFDRLTTVGKVL